MECNRASYPARRCTSKSSIERPGDGQRRLLDRTEHIVEGNSACYGRGALGQESLRWGSGLG